MACPPSVGRKSGRSNLILPGKVRFLRRPAVGGTPRNDSYSAFQKLPRSFYLRPTLTVARELLGKFLVRKLGRYHLVGKIVEVEAYLGKKDPASHAYRGKTKRNEVMFWEGGHLYVYFTYGMHFCANVVTREERVGEAVLIRAVEPIDGIEVMRKRRGFIPIKSGQARDETDYWELTNGPAKFCQAFGIGRKQNGIDLMGKEMFIARGEKIQKFAIGRSARIGIKNGREKKWRFFVKKNRFLSIVRTQ